MDLVQLRVILINMLEQGFLFTFLAFGVLLTFRFFRFPDLTAEGSYPLGGAVVATLLVAGWHPSPAIVVAIMAGSLAGIITALIHTKLGINPIIAGIITMTANYSVMLRIMGRANIPLLNVDTIFDVVLTPVEAMHVGTSSHPVAKVPGCHYLSCHDCSRYLSTVLVVSTHRSRSGSPGDRRKRGHDQELGGTH